jgi:Raf kinase inhibitor-like YbhB/YbcL family protein
VAGMPVKPLNPYDTLPEVPSFTLESGDLTDGERMPDAHVHDSAGGGNLSPSLRWSGAPPETRGYAVTLYDPDAPTGAGFWHWLVLNVPADTTELPTGAGSKHAEVLPEVTITQRNDFGDRYYDGAAPPPGHGDHRYFFAVHALDTDDLGVSADAGPGLTSFNIVAHTIARATLVVTWSS